MLFRGRFNLKLDPKSRFSLPSVFRSEKNSTKNSSQSFVMTNSLYNQKKCLDVYWESEWDRLEKKINGLPQLDKSVQDFQRFYLSGAHRVEIDSQSRVLIPPTLKTYAQLETSIVVVGFSKKFEIWSEDNWLPLFDSMSASFESTLAQVAGLVGEDND